MLADGAVVGRIFKANAARVSSRTAADKRCLGGPSTSPVSNGARNPAASQSVVGFFFGRTLAICHSPVIRHSERFAANLSSVTSCPGRPVRGFFFRPNCAALA